MQKSRPNPEPSPFGRWLLEQAEKQNTTLTGLARMGGMAPSTLRYLVIEPWRVPTLNTCIRLAEVTGEPTEKILKLAGHDIEEISHHPQRTALLNTYDNLSRPMKLVLLRIAQTLVESQL